MLQQQKPPVGSIGPITDDKTECGSVPALTRNGLWFNGGFNLVQNGIKTSPQQAELRLRGQLSTPLYEVAVTIAFDGVPSSELLNGAKKQLTREMAYFLHDRLVDRAIDSAKFARFGRQGCFTSEEAEKNLASAAKLTKGAFLAEFIRALHDKVYDKPEHIPGIANKVVLAPNTGGFSTASVELKPDPANEEYAEFARRTRFKIAATSYLEHLRKSEVDDAKLKEEDLLDMLEVLIRRRRRALLEGKATSYGNFIYQTFHATLLLLSRASLAGIDTIHEFVDQCLSRK